MRIALSVNRLSANRQDNVYKIIDNIEKASRNGADLIMFSETAINGFVITDDPVEDLKLGLEYNSEIIKDIQAQAEKFKINVVLGFIERDGDVIFDTAVFIDKKGEIINKYRRITKGWRHPKMNDSIYKEGCELKVFESDMGKAAFAICGDLFDDSLLEQLNNLEFDVLLFPFARSFYPNNNWEQRWELERVDYENRVKAVGKLSLLVNYLDDVFFGGAMVVSGDGETLCEMKIGQEGIVYYDSRGEKLGK